MDRLIGYVRVSTDEQAKSGLSTSDQSEKLRQYCTLYGYELVDVIVDDGASAKDLNRSGIQRVMEIANSGEVDGVIVCKLDRLTRSVRDLHQLLDTTFKTAQLHSVNEQFNTNTAAGRFVLNMLMSVAEWEREVIGERTSSALQEKKRLAGNRSINGRAPFGYRWEDGELVRDPAEYPVREIMVHLRDAGLTYAQIAQEINDAGHTTRRNKKWRTSSIHTILTSKAS
jgi:DNA invertase Pin-like site-specific DNA recombinase